MIVYTVTHHHVAAVEVGLIYQSVEYVVDSEVYGKAFVKELLVNAQVDRRIRVRVSPVLPVGAAAPPYERLDVPVIGQSESVVQLDDVHGATHLLVFSEIVYPEPLLIHAYRQRWVVYAELRGCVDKQGEYLVGGHICQSEHIDASAVVIRLIYLDYGIFGVGVLCRKVDVFPSGLQCEILPF